MISFSPMAESVAKRRAEVLLVALGFILMAMIVWPLWRPLLIAAVLAGVLSPFHERAVGWLGGRRSLASGLFTAATVLLILIPLTALTIVAIREAIDAVAIVRGTLKSGGIHGLIERAPDSTEYYLEELQKHIPTKLEEAEKQIASGGKWAWGALSGTLGVLGKFGFQLAMMLIAFFFLLRDGGGLVDWMAQSSPLGHRTRELLSELRAVARSVLGANFITGAVQAVVATVGFYIGRAPSPIFFGLLTLFSSLIPSVGSALVTLPVAALVLLLGHPWAALFLVIWSLVVVGLIDNLLRPWLIRGGGQLHGALVFFSLIGAIGAVGAVGLFLGPLILTFFLAAVRIDRRARAA
jgi:predicted PurR-regulated permease PerM